jgi:hypothetical protein
MAFKISNAGFKWMISVLPTLDTVVIIPTALIPNFTNPWLHSGNPLVQCSSARVPADPLNDIRVVLKRICRHTKVSSPVHLNNLLKPILVPMPFLQGSGR